MVSWTNLLKKGTHFSVLLIMIIAFSLLVFSIAHAALLTMSIGSFTDWASAVTFQTDPTGTGDNLSAGATSNEDIAITKVATSTDNYLYFYVQVLGSNLFGSATQYRQAVAELDCDNDGNPNETTDIKINFGIQGNVMICSGDRGSAGGNGCGWTNLFNDFYKSGNAVEWRIKVSDPDTNVPQLYSNCRSGVDINFLLIEINQLGQVQQTYDNTTNSDNPWRGFNVPTKVEFKNIKIQQNPYILRFSGIFLVGVISLIGIVGLRSINKKNRNHSS
jgi:hypothetical protein